MAVPQGPPISRSTRRHAFDSRHEDRKKPPNKSSGPTSYSWCRGLAMHCFSCLNIGVLLSWMKTTSSRMPSPTTSIIIQAVANPTMRPLTTKSLMTVLPAASCRISASGGTSCLESPHACEPAVGRGCVMRMEMLKLEHSKRSGLFTNLFVGSPAPIKVRSIARSKSGTRTSISRMQRHLRGAAWREPRRQGLVLVMDIQGRKIRGFCEKES